MGTLHLLRKPGEGAVTPPRKGSLDRLWERVQARATRRQAQAAEERKGAQALLAELMALPQPQRLEAVEREPRFWTLGLVERLLEEAESNPTLDLAELALALVRRLDPQRYEESLIAEREVVAWSLQAEGHRRRGDFARAESAFRAAERRLAPEPLDGLERASFCRYLARLRQDEGWEDETLALLQRAADLFERWQEPVAAGEVLSELGWFCLDAGDPASAHSFLELAVAPLQHAEPPAALLRVLEGLALCYAGLAMFEEAEEGLAACRVLGEQISTGVETLRQARVEARILERLGRAGEAIARLEAALPALLAERAFYDAALTAVDLAQLYVAQGRAILPAPPEDIERLCASVAPLRAPGALPDRARPVLLFALHLASRRRPHAAEVLAEAGEFLERARERPWLRFQVEPHPRTELSWDLLQPEQRRLLCAEAGLSDEAAALPAAELSATERDLLSWSYELLAGVRIVFESHSA